VRTYLFNDDYVSVSAQMYVSPFDDTEINNEPYLIVEHKSNYEQPKEIIYRISEEFYNAILKEYVGSLKNHVSKNMGGVKSGS
jgi:hypothetical protein